MPVARSLVTLGLQSLRKLDLKLKKEPNDFSKTQFNQPGFCHGYVWLTYIDPTGALYYADLIK